MAEIDTHDLAVPATLRIDYEPELGWYKVVGGVGHNIVVAVFPHLLTAEHFVRYCVDEQKTYAGVIP